MKGKRMPNQNSIIHKHLAATTSLAIALTDAVASVAGYQVMLAEEILCMTPNKSGVIALLSKMEQTQASLSALRESAASIEREMRACGLI